jgi:hypothetical protein
MEREVGFVRAPDVRQNFSRLNTGREPSIGAIDPLAHSPPPTGRSKVAARRGEEPAASRRPGIRQLAHPTVRGSPAPAEGEAIPLATSATATTSRHIGPFDVPDGTLLVASTGGYSVSGAPERYVEREAGAVDPGGSSRTGLPGVFPGARRAGRTFSRRDAGGGGMLAKRSARHPRGWATPPP